MPRRRYRRVEWSDAMASHATLVEGTDAVPAPTDTTTYAADTRPSLIRSTSVSPQVQAPVARSGSEQTTTGSSDSPAVKLHTGLMSRIRESLRRQLRNFSAHVMQTHFHESTRGIEGYYSVSLH
ncbi:hypothetical protein LPJ77_005342 [Coemansia sp. RSA 2523]|nr:hypothetical protein LPJ54_005149 [Coemansia sp. RSA 1824]KAJ1803254.1 hypothetical protein LPJ77_005342 [Coemansia sp. RSA 2523]KAJ2115509.1 hypothetical protein GGF48_004940 [Coemansia sp. RSA 921]KAJ2169603.1 hypothetical protein GGH15_000401 [Coemansia sp. RSA 562]KAJ2196135.1 hypothetical protein GGH18_001712 [Coemansia sp. RSA 530]KAJ2277436.1 hypothetical protein J3F81_000945 [Coemansia sp. RSA 371]KAJ2279063.1 hypothetical protein GGH14_002871 [Coemansia sp. RSA 370]KAJ2300410.1 h